MVENPYESPRTFEPLPAPRENRAALPKRRLLLIAALGLVGGAGVELYRFATLLASASERRLPPTMFTQHLGVAITLGAMGAVLVVIACRQRRT